MNLQQYTIQLQYTYVCRVLSEYSIMCNKGQHMNYAITYYLFGIYPYSTKHLVTTSLQAANNIAQRNVQWHTIVIVEHIPN